MALSNLATHLLIPAGPNDPRLDVVDGVVLHVDAGNSTSLFPYFNGPSGGIESHFFVKKDADINGNYVEQYRDTAYEADANLDGNSWIGADGKRHGLLSVETQGLGPGTWTDIQVTTIKRLLLELSVEHGFPLCRINAWNGRGVGYHTMWGAPSHWTPVAKSCPGPDRIKQFNDVFVPWFTSATHSFDKLDPASYYLGVEGPHVRWLGERLVAHGYTQHGDADGYQPGPVFSEYDRLNVRDAQTTRGLTGGAANGLPGRKLLLALALPPKIKVPGPTTAAQVQLQEARDAMLAATAEGSRPKAKKALGFIRRALAALRGK